MAAGMDIGIMSQALLLSRTGLRHLLYTHPK